MAVQQYAPRAAHWDIVECLAKSFGCMKQGHLRKGQWCLPCCPWIWLASMEEFEHWYVRYYVKTKTVVVLQRSSSIPEKERQYHSGSIN